MARNIIDIRDEFRKAKFDVNLLQNIDCSPEDNRQYLELLKNGQALPQGVYRKKDIDGRELDLFYTVYDPQLSEKEISEYIELMQYKEIRTIRKCVVFFTVLTIISLILGIIAGLSLADILA